MNRKTPNDTKRTIRELAPEEIPSIYPLIRQLNPSLTPALFTKRLKDMLPFGYRAVAVFEGEKMVGVSGFWVHSRFWCGRHLDIDNFFVLPDYRGKRIGQKLTAWLEKKALEEKCELMVLDVYSDNFLAHRFYHREGFVATGSHFTKVPGTSTPWGRTKL